LYVLGTLARKASPALRAASSLDGRTSFAVIERETSIASTTVASFRGIDRWVCGRAAPRIIAMSATKKSVSGT
jgi:hypothetical protein